MKTLKLIPAILLGLLISCDSEDLDNPHFPLEIGTTWTYDWSTDDEDFPTRHRTINITITNKEEINGIETYRFETVSVEEPELISEHFYFWEDDQLKLLAYNVSAVSDANARYSFQPYERILQSIIGTEMSPSDERVIEDPARIIYEYPLEVGKNWVHWEQDGNELITKTVEAQTEIAVPAWTFTAYKVINGGSWYDSKEIEIIDYIATVGLVKRTISFNQTDGHVTGSKRVNILVELKEIK